MSKLDRIRQQITDHADNAWAKQQGWGPVYTAHEKAKILIIGQAPGRLAQESGVPWDDPSGRNLRKWMGVDDEVFYDETKVALVPMDFYFPGSKERGDLPPRPEFVKKWHEPILAEMPSVQLTMLIGQYAHNYYLGNERKRNLTETVRAFAEFQPGRFPLVHPSPRNNIWQKKNPWFETELLPHLRAQVKLALDL
ncbi:MAG: uracil-DNA glycosylase family protein [Acidimicrobiales bacterium]|nr:uracil-DNA glycosylase family protein [Hyphomonadaceae bacterium]RZV38274.1 MAG: uracil-DNA glycosylase family protein [Acidimicrobiales bacterium]